MNKAKFIRTIISTAVLAAIHLSTGHAQTNGPAVGQWRSFLPYSQVNGIATDGTTFFCATTSGFFTYNRTDGSLTGYSKETGMHDIGLNTIAYDPLTAMAVLGYSTSNIDLFKDGSFSNIPSIKLSQSTGDKTIHNIIAADGEAYLSTGVGLVVLNLTKEEIKETVVFYDSTLSAAVYAATLDDSFLYASTSVGLFRINKDNAFIENYLIWEKLSDKVFQYLTTSNNKVYAAVADSLFELSTTGNPDFKAKMADSITSINPENNGTGVWVSAADQVNAQGFGVLKKEDGTTADTIATIFPSQIIQLANGEVWFGDQSDYRFVNNHGLRKRTAVGQSVGYFPSGPITDGCFDVSAYNGDFWVAHGGKNDSWAPLRSRAMFSHFSNGNWENFPWISPNANFQDFVRILKDQNTGNLYAASYYGGLYEQDPGAAPQTFSGSSYFPPFANTTDVFLVSGLALDGQGNLWMSNYGGSNELVVKTYDGKWYKMLTVDGNAGHTAADVIVDDYGQKWFIAVENGGAVVYNDNGTIDNTTDDQYRIYKTGATSGNLPDNNTLSIVKDKEGSIWIGTSNGIAIVTCGDQALTDCQAYLKPYQDDQFAGYLFQGQSIYAMAVDGANRKWIGTSNGVWLLSSEGDTIITKFTEDNSPLLSNSIEHINIDPVTGDVYFSTNKGLISYRGTATEGNTTDDKSLYIYPDPVPSNYDGMIAIRGVAANSDVRITDITGQLVYRTIANGGQAVWNGMDYTGHKAQSGVYLVFAVSKDGTQKTTGKFILHR